MCIHGPRKSLRQGSERRVVILNKKIRNGGKICATYAGYVPGKRNSGEVYSRNYRKFQHQGWTAPGNSVKSFPVCNDYGWANGRSKERNTVTMVFADGIVICEETREEVEQRLECWRYAWERKGMKVSRSKTEYLCINGGNDKETVKMEDKNIPRVKEFKYFGSTMQESGCCKKEVKRRVQTEWNGWRKVSGVICDRRYQLE